MVNLRKIYSRYFVQFVDVKLGKTTCYYLHTALTIWIIHVLSTISFNYSYLFKFSLNKELLLTQFILLSLNPSPLSIYILLKLQFLSKQHRLEQRLLCFDLFSFSLNLLCSNLLLHFC